MQISILIPTYNDDCTQLVTELWRQAEAASDLEYEILVGDDGSDDTAVKAAIAQLGSRSHCRVVSPGRNVGRAAIRNLLARQAAFDRLLFVDGDMAVRDGQFLNRYLKADAAAVVYGGYQIPPDATPWKHNLRYRYEQRHAANHDAQKRQQRPDSDFHTSNFLTPRSVMLRHPLDEQFRHYGYEDVLWGKQLTASGIAIAHVDNPVSFERFETNADFVAKTEEGLRTLHRFQAQIGNHSTLLRLHRMVKPASPMVRWAFRTMGPSARRRLAGNHPSLLLFSLYKLGYFCSLG